MSNPMRMKHEAADATLVVSASAQSISKYMAGPEVMIISSTKPQSFALMIHLQLETC